MPPSCRCRNLPASEDDEDGSTVKIGIWASGNGRPDPNDGRRERLAASDCLVEGSAWTTMISHELLQAGAERILAGARLPDDSGEPPIREDAEAAIVVEFDPAQGRVRTTLEFNVPVGPFNPGGTCWIDDVLSVDPLTGMVVPTTTAGMDVDPFMESGCQKFQAFMTDGGAGEQALSLLPAAIELTDGSSAVLRGCLGRCEQRRHRDVRCDRQAVTRRIDAAMPARMAGRPTLDPAHERTTMRVGRPCG